MNNTEELVTVALAPFYVMATVAAAFTVAKLIRSFTDSATQTALTETVPEKTKI